MLCCPLTTGKAGGNLFWINFGLDPVIAHTPIRQAQCERLAATHFEFPNYLPSDLIVAVTPKDNKKTKTWNFDPPLRVVSPMETVFAMIIAIQRDLLDDQAMQKWRRVTLSTSMLFKAGLENEADFHWTHVQCRENPGIEFDVVRHSALQRIFDVAQFVKRTETLTGQKQSAKTVSQAYTSKLKLADSSEKVTPNLVESALSAASFHQSCNCS